MYNNPGIYIEYPQIKVIDKFPIADGPIPHSRIVVDMSVRSLCQDVSQLSNQTAPSRSIARCNGLRLNLISKNNPHFEPSEISLRLIKVTTRILKHGSDFAPRSPHIVRTSAIVLSQGWGGHNLKCQLQVQQ